VIKTLSSLNNAQKNLVKSVPFAQIRLFVRMVTWRNVRLGLSSVMPNVSKMRRLLMRRGDYFGGFNGDCKIWRDSTNVARLRTIR